jgi:hypothetical protein
MIYHAIAASYSPMSDDPTLDRTTDLTPPTADWLPKLTGKTVRRSGRSFFQDDQSRLLPSVSTILNATKPREAREALAQWRSRLGTAEATRITTTASRRGSQTHKQLRQFLEGRVASCPESARPYWQSLQPVLAELDAVRLVESPVFHYDLGYAGRVDCVVSYRGVPCLCDWKTADVPKSSIDRLYDAPLQLAAYCGAVNHCYSDLKLNHGMVVVALPDQPAQVFWFETAAVRDYWQQWRDRLEQFYRRY